MLAKTITKYVRVKPHCNIGTIGHVNHGKTTLTAAIRKCQRGIWSRVFHAYQDKDSNVEERTRGIKIKAAKREYFTESRHYRHQEEVKNKLIGAVHKEGAKVAVNEGPQVQTREHIRLAKEVGIPYMIVYINKLDSMLEKDKKDLVEVRELLESYGFPKYLPVVKGSARKALTEDKERELGIGKKKFCG